MTRFRTLATRGREGRRGQRDGTPELAAIGRVVLLLRW